MSLLVLIQSIINATEEELYKIVKEYFDKRVKEGTVIEHRVWREKIFVQSMKDTQECLELIYKCITGQVHFIQYYLKIAHESMLNDFQESVVDVSFFNI